MKLPKNIITQNKYTSGKEYILKDTQKEYQGNYYSINGKSFAGKTFDQNAPELQKITESNSFLSQAFTFAYSKLKNLPSTKNFSSVIWKPTQQEADTLISTRFFAKKNNTIPYLIKEISRNDFDSLQNDNEWQTISLKFYLLKNDTESGHFDQNELEMADKKMVGLKTFLEV